MDTYSVHYLTIKKQGRILGSNGGKGSKKEKKKGKKELKRGKLSLFCICFNYRKEQGRISTHVIGEGGGGFRVVIVYTTGLPSVTSSSRVPLTWEKHHWVSLLTKKGKW